MNTCCRCRTRGSPFRKSRGSDYYRVKRRMAVAAWLMAVAACAWAASDYTIFPGDGSEEPGFVPPPLEPRLPSPPPRTVASAETSIPLPGPPVVPMARTEAKKPPRPPVLFIKIKTQHPLDWCATPNDVNNLLRRMREMADVNYAMEIKTLGQVDAVPDTNPILYRSGHYHFSFTPAERAKLRTFMLDGGMIIFNTGLGSKPFYDSAVAELSLILPEVHVQRLSSDHPIFHSYYDLDRVRYRPGVLAAGFRGHEPWFDGVTIDCRTVAVISRWGMAVGWEENENDGYQAYVSEDAQKLGLNLFAYATAQRAWARTAARKMRFVDEDKTTADKMFMAQAIYDGEWKTRHAGMSVLLQTFNLKTEIPVKFALRELRLTDPALFDMPLLYITGHENFQLSREEGSRLRQYLEGGGLLVAEACCGRKGFDLAFRLHMRALLPEYPLQPIPPGHSVFALPNRIETLGVTPALAAQLGDSAVRPRLEGIEIKGHYAVIYSAFGMAGGWEMSQSPYAHGYDDTGSLLLGQNILMYAITQ